MNTVNIASEKKAHLSRLLNQRYGSGEIYLTHADDRTLLNTAIELGLVNAYGYLTPQGRQFWAAHPAH